MPISFRNIRSGYDLYSINYNFTLLEQKFDEKLDRNVSSQGNEMRQDLDMNGHRILNVGDSFPLSGEFLGPYREGLTFTTPYDYSSYKGQVYRVGDTNQLPYTAQGSDPTVTPDAGIVAPFAEVTRSDLEKFTIFAGSASELGAVPDPSVGQVAVVAGAQFVFDGSGWAASGAISPEYFGAVGDGVTDDSDAIQSAIDSNNNILFYGNFKCNKKIDFRATGRTYIFSGEIIYGGNETDRLADFSGDNNVFYDPVFSGGNLQVNAGLCYVPDDVKGLVFNNPTFKDVAGILTGAVSLTRNNQSGLIVSPWGVDIKLNEPQFLNITNDNTGTYDTQTIGYGFCSGLLLARDTLVTTGDNSGNPTKITCKSPYFNGVQTILNSGLSENDAIDLNDGDAIRVIGNTSDTIILGNFTNVVVRDCSKRAVKASTSKGMNFNGVDIYDSGLQYPMVQGVRCTSQGYVKNVRCYNPSNRPIGQAITIEKTSGLKVSGVWVENCKGVLGFNPDTNIQNNIYDLSISDVTAQKAIRSGITISSAPNLTRNISIKDIDITLDGVGQRGYEQLTGSDGAANAEVSNVVIRDGDVTMRGLNLKVDNVKQVISNPDYEGASATSKIMALGNSRSLSATWCSFTNIHCLVNACIPALDSTGRSTILEIQGNGISVDNVLFRLPEYVGTSIPVIDIFGDDIDASNFNCETIGYLGIARTADSYRMKVDKFTKRGGANTRQFLVSTRGVDTVFTNITDYSETNNVAIQETGSITGQNCFVDGVYTKTTATNAVVITNGTAINTQRF